MKQWIAFWSIVGKDMRTYYLKPPNISWGIIFPIAWTGMFFIKSGSGLESIHTLLPGVIAISVLFGTTSMLAVTVTFENQCLHPDHPGRFPERPFRYRLGNLSTYYYFDSYIILVHGTSNCRFGQPGV
jgi:hypothetical protein